MKDGKPTARRCRVIFRPRQPEDGLARINRALDPKYRVERRTIAGMEVLVVVKAEEEQ